MNRIERALQDSTQDEYWTLRQTAEFLGSSEPTLRKHLKSGAVPGVKIGRKWFISKQGLKNCLTSAPDSRKLEAPQKKPVS